MTGDGDRFALDAAIRERDAALAMSERYRDHEFARPLDTQGCCAVCHQPLDFEAHRPASLASALASLRAEAEQLHVQLAGCSVAALGWAAGDNDCEQGAYGWSVPFDDVKQLRAKADRMRGAIRDALNELGVPGDGYPMPVANAHVILSEAIADAEQGRALLGDPRRGEVDMREEMTSLERRDNDPVDPPDLTCVWCGAPPPLSGPWWNRRRGRWEFLCGPCADGGPAGGVA